MLLALPITTVQAQNKVKIERAGSLELGRRGSERFNKVVGNVLFTQGRTKIYCDSAYLYKKTNNIEAFGHIRIVDDSVTITSKKLFYNGNTRIAKLRENVVYKSKDFTLYTNFLDYNRLKSEATYFNRGRLVDSTNVVTSQKGYFQSWRNIMAFKTNVVMTNKKRNP